jgi:hypothetical protein
MRVGRYGVAAIGLGAAVCLGCGSNPPEGQDEPAPLELPWAKDVELPLLEAGNAVGFGMLISASTTQISVDGEPVQALVVGPSNEIEVPAGKLKGQMITELYDVLAHKAQQQKALSEKAGVGFDDRVLLQADQALPWTVLRQVLYTASQAQYDLFQVVGEHRETHKRLSLPLPLTVIGPGMKPILTSFEEVFGLQLSLRLDSSGFFLSTGGHAVDAFYGNQTMLLPCDSECTNVDSYPWKELQQVLAKVRQQFPVDCSTAGRIGGAAALVPRENETQQVVEESPKAGQESLEGTAQRNEIMSGVDPTLPDYGYLPPACLLVLNFSGRRDLPWWWWFRLVDGKVVGPHLSETSARKAPLYPFWTPVSGPTKDEEFDPAPYSHVPTCQNSDCSIVAPLIQLGPRLPPDMVPPEMVPERAVEEALAH